MTGQKQKHVHVEGEVEKPLKKAYKDAIDFLNDNYAYFVTHVLNTGKPVLNPAFPTAAVFWNTKTNQMEFHIGREMLKLSTEQFAFVLSHETMHAHLNHLKFLQKVAGVPADRRMEDLTKAESNNLQAANVAADCVINDYLWSRGFDLPEWVMTGEKVVQHDCSTYTVKEVYDELPRQPSGEGEGDEDGEGGFSFGDGQGGGCGVSEEMRKAIEKFLEENPEMVKAGEGSPMDGKGGIDVQPADGKGQPSSGQGNFPKQIDDMNKDSNAQVAQGVTAGFGQTNEMAAWAADNSTSLRWMELLRQINPDMFRHQGIGKKVPRDFHARSRKLHHGSLREVSLPIPARQKSRKEGPTDEIPLIALALDTSGSIQREDANRFITLAKSIPQKRIFLWVCTFTTSWNELDLENPHYPSGGTSFSAIEKFIQYKMKETGKPYPKAVVAITDGHASFGGATIPEGKSDNWTWLLTEDGYAGYIEGIGQHFPLLDFIQ